MPGSRHILALNHSRDAAKRHPEASGRVHTRWEGEEMTAISTRRQQTGFESVQSYISRWTARRLSRRQLMRSAAGVTGLTMGLSQIRAAEADPKPIPGGIQPFGPGTEI